MCNDTDTRALHTKYVTSHAYILYIYNIIFFFLVPIDLTDDHTYIYILYIHIMMNRYTSCITNYICLSNTTSLFVHYIIIS